MLTPADSFISQSRKLLLNEYWPKICRCLQALPEEDLWWRPNPVSNSVGNLLLHLAGNIRQWIVSGVGQQADTRERQKEFDASSGLDSTVLLKHLHESLLNVDEVLARITVAELTEPRVVQGIHVSVGEAIYHVVEHFSTHVGQIIYITKMRSGADMRFYEMNADGTVRRGWLSDDAG